MPMPCSRHATRARTARDPYAFRITISTPSISHSARRASSTTWWPTRGVRRWRNARRRSSGLHC
eukprot:11160595-Lingulodinium_polyedra.AAC.1